MERPDLATLACVNSECHCFVDRALANLSIRKVYGHDGIRLLRCHTCGEEFSERRGTALFNTKLPEAKAEDVIDHLDEGCSVRATARLMKVAKETVARLLRVAGRHAQRFHDQQVYGLTPGPWNSTNNGVLSKKTEALPGPRDGEGWRMWDPTAVTADSKLVVTLVVGKRTKDQTNALVKDARSRLSPGHLPAIFTDAYEGYESAILDAFGRRYPARASGEGPARDPSFAGPKGWRMGR